ncbi:DUF2142 domain-containing protein [Cryobacterium algoricola]|uniref:DUF2142 domain-containing protein n=1 Tax=Cryobacterium algoricola TaxID=1259183 RepID=A0ABY2IHJ2_9MICO|nr:DUF2142 domain-containing protein [Cryobacterium algoricola]TFB91269.1 DUF2142 domain-containing protein [Cryobacterium algoricola]
MIQIRSPRVHARRLATILAPVFVFLALVSWGLASPVGASPDDDFHLNSIWCGDGFRDGLCEPAATPDKRLVPGPLGASACFAFNSRQGASCQTAVGLSSDSYSMVATPRGNWRGDYPPLFYSVMGVFAGTDLSVSVMLMRAFNAALFVALTTTIFLLLPRHRRTALVWGYAITLVPLGMFLVPSTNPSSWAIISAGTLWGALLGYFESAGWRKAALGTLAALSTVIGAAARADAAVYAVIAIGVVVLLTARRERKFVVSLVLPVALVLISSYFYLSSGQSAVSGAGLPSPSGQAGGWMHFFVADVMEVPSLWAGALGLSGLGWLDTPMPAVVWLCSIAVCCSIAFTGIHHTFRRKSVAVILVFAALWAIPTYVLVRSRVPVGEQVQPRYILPLIIILAGLTLLQRRTQSLSLSRTQITVIVAALSLANALALHADIRRYVTGTDITSWNLDTAAGWWWGFAPSPMTLWSIGSVSFAGAVALLAILLWPRAQDATAGETAASALA